ncbi:hypothetical protein SAMN05446037_1006103 [Anaerovirgula multivorans]|uniref:Uncharacterized protein n=1 Tax=Anaerovirgula multivorans TaxID=312168 RepID=A0A239CRI9_9FIRM|nr:hypothetical protein [Anaerovirgula multivorans]SNS22482.1 hypothetical protein SAMN05446037_1006103 [Anaerovirgula multivorans]
MDYEVVKPNLITQCKKEKEFNKRMQKTLGKRMKRMSSLTLSYSQCLPITELSGNLRLLIHQHEKGFSFKIVSTSEKIGYVFALLEEEIVNVYFVDGEEIFEERSVIGRGIIGTLVAGPLGAIIGGLSGLSQAKAQDKYMIIKTNEYNIIFKFILFEKLQIGILQKDFKKALKEKIITKDSKRQQELKFLDKL